MERPFTVPELALAHDTIIVGNVSSSKLAQTRMAKSVLDAGWSTFRKEPHNERSSQHAH